MTETSNSKTTNTASNQEKKCCCAISNFFCNKKFFSKKTCIALGFIIIGIFITLAVQKIARAAEEREFQKAFLIRDFHHPHHFYGFDDDFFDEFKKAEARTRQIFAHNQKIMQQALMEAKNNNNYSKTALKNSQDDENYYYELWFSGLDKDKINVAVKDNSLTFSAKEEKENDGEKMASNFYYSFSLPEFNQKKEPEITRLDDKIVVKLKKK